MPRLYLLRHLAAIALLVCTQGTAHAQGVPRWIPFAGTSASPLISVPVATPSTAASSASQATVIQVIDGDTLRVARGSSRVTIRLAQIDAPEVCHLDCAQRPSQPFGQASARQLRTLALGQQAMLQCHDTDRYGREVCRVTVAGQDLSSVQVRTGLAWFSERFGTDQSLRAASQQAQRERLGLWSDPRAVAPWDWRRDCWERQQCT